MRPRFLLPVLPLLVLALAGARCASSSDVVDVQAPEMTVTPASAALSAPSGDHTVTKSTLQLDPAEADTAIFAMGCFWCAETAFEGRDGIATVVSGFAGGTVANPTYNQVTRGGTGHYEVVEVVYDPEVIAYDRLLEIFWRNVDPFDGDGQFCDRGESYRPAILATSGQRDEAVASLQAVEARFDDMINVPILEDAPFYPAEEYHQDFWLKSPERYQSYRRGCRRDERLREVWGDEAGAGYASAHSADDWRENYTPMTDEQLRDQLTPIQYEVAIEDGTERPFDNPYWDNHRAGIYVDVVSGQPLFSSTDKFESGTGWPSFTRPIDPDAVQAHDDRSMGMVRSEIRSSVADIHLGHVFDDGPEPTGLRYCMNSAAMRFVPVDEMAEQGYAAYLPIFEGTASADE